MDFARRYNNFRALQLVAILYVLLKIVLFPEIYCQTYSFACLPAAMEGEIEIEMDQHSDTAGHDGGAAAEMGGGDSMEFSRPDMDAYLAELYSENERLDHSMVNCALLLTQG